MTSVTSGDPSAGGAARIVNTANFHTIAHPALPTGLKKLTLDTSIEEKRNLEIWPEPGNLIDKAPITFCIDHTPEYLVDISSIGLDIKLQIKNVKAGEGAAARGAMPVFFTNNLISSLFSTAKVEFNNHVVEANYNLPMTSRLDHILTTSDEVTEECGQVQGTFPIKSDSPANTISAGFIGKNTTKERIKYTRGNIVHIRGPLPLDITLCVDWLVDGVNIKV